MRLTFILSSLHLSGGVRVVIEYSRRLVQRGHQVSFVIPGGTADAGILEDVSRDICIYQSRQLLQNADHPLSKLRLAWSMAQVVPTSDFIITTHTPTTAVGFFAGTIMKKGKPIWFYQDYPEMFERRPVELWLMRNAMIWHDFSMTVSEACAQDLRVNPSRKVIIVGEGIDLSRYHRMDDARKLDYGDGDKKAILFVGDARPRKGLLDFINAAEKVYTKETGLVMWLVSKEPTPIVTRIPYRLFIKPTDLELARLYSACDIFVSASWYEGFGLPPLEAMACGAPVITTDSRGVREFAVDGENCLVVPIKNPDRIAEAILALLSNPGLADQFRRNGPLTAKRFSWELATDRLETALLNSSKN